MDIEKEIRWIGSSYDDLMAFPQAPRKEAGFQLGKVQAGFATSKRDKGITEARYRAVVNSRKAEK